ncbi:MAG: major capsid protein [Microvirus sp.]|nr:MAG: major capsid protein [Microvirus sp.]
MATRGAPNLPALITLLEAAMHRNKSVDATHFAMVPDADIPRSSFNRESSIKTTFNAGYLVPFMLDEVLPGDQFKIHATLFARMTTPIFPIMDNLHLDTFFFFVPNRLIWTNWVKFMGEQDNPADSISYVIPQCVSPAGGYAVGSLQNYMFLPSVGQVLGGNTYSHSVLPLRGYNMIYNEWFRDENLQNSVVENKGDGPDLYTDYTLLRRGKRKDYFTSALPWPQKGGAAVTLPLGTSALVKLDTTLTGKMTMRNAATRALTASGNPLGSNASSEIATQTTLIPQVIDPNGQLYADLSTATAATINQLRQSFQIQKLLERDARGGTRYTEIVRSHFGVISPDSRLQRPEYIGGGSTMVNINPVAQTNASTVTGSTTPLSTLSGFATAIARNGCSYSATEHGYIIGLMSVRADLTYQQGLDKHWSRSTRYDFYFPVFAALGEQTVLNKEIYLDGSANDALVFGYQERWAEYRYKPSKITGLFNSRAAGTLDGWHLAQNFTSLPTLNNTFIVDTPPMDRILAVTGTTANSSNFYLDGVIEQTVARPMPMYSVPGLIDHF